MRPLPELTPWTSWFWTSGADGTLRIQGCDRLRHAGAPARPGLPGVPEPVLDPDRGLGPGHGRRVHGQPAPVASRPAAALRDRRGGPRRGPGGPADHQHRRVRRRRRRRRASRSRSASSSATTCGSPCSSRPGRPPRPNPTSAPKLPAPRAPLGDEPVRAPGRCSRAWVARPSGAGCMVDPLSLTVDACLAAVADAGLELVGHRRAVHLPGRRRHGDERGRCGRGRGGAAPASHLDQRRRWTSPGPAVP